MAGPDTRVRVRRGAIVVLDGLAICLLAVVLARYEAGEPSAATGLFETTAGRIQIWMATPGVGPFELAAYAGLALAFLGPLWYWGLRGLVIGRGFASTGPDGTSADFDTYLAGLAEGTYGGSGRAMSTSGAPVPPTKQTGGSTSPDWVPQVFDGTTFTDGGSSVFEPRRRDFPRSPGRTTTGAVDRRASIPRAGQSTSTDPDNVSTSREDSPGGRTGDGRAGLGDGEAAPVTQSPALATALNGSQSKPPTDSGSPVPAAALEQLALELDAGQAAIEAVSDRLASAAAQDCTNASGDPVGAGVDAPRSVREAVTADEFSFLKSIDELRPNQDRLESGISAVLADKWR